MLKCITINIQVRQWLFAAPKEINRLSVRFILKAHSSAVTHHGCPLLVITLCQDPVLTSGKQVKEGHVVITIVMWTEEVRVLLLLLFRFSFIAASEARSLISPSASVLGGKKLCVE